MKKYSFLAGILKRLQVEGPCREMLIRWPQVQKGMIIKRLAGGTTMKSDRNGKASILSTIEWLLLSYVEAAEIFQTCWQLRAC